MAGTKRVLIAGIYHETHTFVPGTTRLADFACLRGQEMLRAEGGDTSPLGGSLEAARACGWEAVPAIDYRALPGGTVEDAVLETWWDDFQQRARSALTDGPLDGLFLVLHGAMVTTNCRDVEGELLARIRALPGLETIPIGGVTDLHANVSAPMARLSTALITYRRNPHTDARETAVRAVRILDSLLENTHPHSQSPKNSPFPRPTIQHPNRYARIQNPNRYAISPQIWGVGGRGKGAGGLGPQARYGRPPLVLTPTATGTDDEPMRTLEALARRMEATYPELLAVNVHAGFAFADTPDTGVSFTITTRGDVATADRLLEELSRAAMQTPIGSQCDEMSIEEALKRLAMYDTGPVLLVEPSDNIGAGAPGEGVTLLRALVAHEIRNAGVIVNDPAAVTALADLTPGERRTLTLGGKSSPLYDGSCTLEVELISRSDGRFTLEDPHSHMASMLGSRIEMGPCTVVRHGGVRILLTSRATAPFDLGQWRSQGIAPENLHVIGIKAAVAHRQAYNPIARATIYVRTPGPCCTDLRDLPFRHLRRPIRPLDE